MFDDDDLSDEEKQLIREAEGARGTYGSGGAAIGGVLGGLAGAATGLFTAGSTTIPGATIGSGLGASVGGAIGNWLGGNAANEAEARAAALRKKREEAMIGKDNSSVTDLLGPWLSATRGMV